MDARVVLLLALAALVQSRDVTVGVVTTGRQIYNETKQASPALWRQSQNVTIAANGTDVISRVIITDLRPEKDGDAKIVAGGEGQKNVTIEMKSPTILRGFEFQIEVFAVSDDGSYTFGNNTEIEAVPAANTTTSLEEEETTASENENDDDDDGDTEVNIPVEVVRGEDTDVAEETQPKDNSGQTEVTNQPRDNTGLKFNTQSQHTGVNKPQDTPLAGVNSQDNTRLTGDNNQAKTNAVTENANFGSTPSLTLGSDVAINGLSRRVRDTSKTATTTTTKATPVKPTKEVINEPTEKPRLYSASTRAPDNHSTATKGTSEKPKTRQARDNEEHEKLDQRATLPVVDARQEKKGETPKFQPIPYDDDNIEVTTKVGIVITPKSVNGIISTMRPIGVLSKDVKIPETKTVDGIISTQRPIGILGKDMKIPETKSEVNKNKPSVDPTLILPSSTIASIIHASSEKDTKPTDETSTILPLSLISAALTTSKTTDTKDSTTGPVSSVKSEGKLPIPDAPAVLGFDNTKPVQRDGIFKTFDAPVGPKRYIPEKPLY